MEFGDEKPKGLKARLFRAIDPQARAEAADRKKSDIRETIAARKAAIEEERMKRAEIREGKRKGGFGSYVGSTIRESRQSVSVRGLEEKLDPNLKKTRKIDREIKGLQTRQKWRKRVQKVDDVFDNINTGLDKVQGFAGGGKKSGNMFGISDADLKEMSGLGGGGSGFGGSAAPRRKSAKRGMLPIYSGGRIVGYTQGKSKRKTRKQKSIFDIDIGF